MNQKELKPYLGKQTTFEVRKLVVQAGLPVTLALDLDRIELEHKLTETGLLVVRGLLQVATKSEEVFDFPENFLVRWGRAWHTFKVQKFPRWLKKYIPIVTYRVWAVSKFPELNIPPEFRNSEFIHFRVIKERNVKAPT